jgi:hypothetical protein
MRHLNRAWFELERRSLLNGIFEFNISRLLAFLDAHAERFPIETIEIAAISNYPRDEEAVHGV